jgi:glycosyltransferase involved in cell wall biosynthesis
MDREGEEEGVAGVKRPVPVCRVIARLNIGGPALHVVNLTAGLDRRGTFTTRLIAGRVTEDEGDMEYYARDNGVTVLSLPALSRVVRPLQDVRILWTLFRIFQREQPYIVHTHTAKAGALGRLAALLAGVPVRIHTFHGHVLGGDYFSPRLTAMYRWMETQLARVTQRLVVLTESQKRELAKDLGIASPEKFSVIPLGLELRRFTEVDRGSARRKARASLGIGPEEVTVGVVGRLVPVKNHPLLFRALPLLRRELGRPARLLVVGSGLREGELRTLARESGIQDYILWLGWRTDLPDLYPAMDCLALTSFDEGTPVAVLEALASGTPVAARAVGGVPEILSGVALARLIPEASPESAASTMAEVLRLEVDEEERNRIRYEVANRYAASRLVDDVQALYLRELQNAAMS